MSIKHLQLLRAFQEHFPFAVSILERSLELILAELPGEGCQPMVAPSAPSFETLPLIFGASTSNRASPVTSFP